MDRAERTLEHEPPLVSPRENCRNWPRAVFYNGAKTAKKALVDALDTLVAEGFEPGQIVVLSRRSARNCLAASIDSPPWSDRLKPLATVGSGGYTGYDSIYRFKGREAPAIVITDVDPLAESGRWSDVLDVRSLLYMGVTRALSRVVVVAHEDWRDELPWAAMDGMGLDAAEAARARAELAGEELGADTTL